ncbi:MAG: hypothetical protein A2Y20_04935 [Firmicutes bacterium GWF2_51_9]|nr:MAG: hypothetical protein A2Y20_04935 [Firmicutes bacterium GWF2_51_9]OGS57404.1 MAG: hypothetical protein A2Y19_02760 [Firmicutes bacterium GWE2_51_13]HBZ41522.1 hypothetical protein [Erysipelotrichaceae bacterium]
METLALIEHFKARGKSDQEIYAILDDVKELEDFILEHRVKLENLDVPLLRTFIAKLIREERNTMARLVNLMRYFGATRQYDLYIYFTSLVNSTDVIDQITRRLDPKTKAKIDSVGMPPLGSDIGEMPDYTATFMDTLADTMDRPQLRKTLAGNNHEIPREAFSKEKEIFDKTDSLDEYLVGLNQRGIATLQKHADSGLIWFEQVITQEVVDYVKTNPEIMSATRVGNKLYTAKIPYDTVNFLRATDLDTKRFYACHCPFVRTSFLTQHPKVDKDWCYCSAGFGKFLYEVLFDEELDVEVLETPLSGSTLCRFAITIPQRIMALKTPKVNYENDRY